MIFVSHFYKPLNSKFFALVFRVLGNRKIFFMFIKKPAENRGLFLYWLNIALLTSALSKWDLSSRLPVRGAWYGYSGHTHAG
jgi:hypothetical protein